MQYCSNSDCRDQEYELSHARVKAISWNYPDSLCIIWSHCIILNVSALGSHSFRTKLQTALTLE